MSSPKINPRKLFIKEGMTPEDVRKNSKATPQQKAFANIFDSDGIKGYSAREAEVFNSTSITCNGKKGITLWTSYKDGSKERTIVPGDIASFKYTPKDEDQRLYEMEQAAINIDLAEQETINAEKLINKYVAEGKGTLKVERFENGQVKTKLYRNNETQDSIRVNYYENGNLKYERISEYNGCSLYDVKIAEYYPNGQVKKCYVLHKGYRNLKTKEFYEEGTLKYEKTTVLGKKEYIDTKITEYYPNSQVKKSIVQDREQTKKECTEFYEDGKLKSEKISEYKESRCINVTNTEYYHNGKVKKSYLYSKEQDKKKTKEFYENGKPKSYIEETWKENADSCKLPNGKVEYYDDYVKTTEVYYDKKGKIINNAIVAKEHTE